MCEYCDYPALLAERGLAATGNRLRVLEIVGGAAAPLSAHEIHEALRAERHVNRVTLYRILDLLVGHGLLERMSAGDRAFRYGPAPNSVHRRHPHFFCTRCGAMQCLPPEAVTVDLSELGWAFPNLVEKVELRLDGICEKCLGGRR